ncbi:MAG: hypothetical protein ABF649_01000 [Bacillus sp. (in: firmicutes)]
MNNQKKFFSLLKPVQRSLFMELLIKEIQFLLLEAGIVLLFSYLLANFVIIPFLNWYILISFFLLFVVFLLRLWFKRPTSKETVTLFNTYVAEDYALTGFHYVNNDGAMEQLVVEQALKEMRTKQRHVLKRKKHFFYPKLIVLSFLCFASYTVLLQFPSSTFQLGKKKEEEINVIAKTKKELDKKVTKETNKQVADTLKKVDKELIKTDTVKKAFQSMEKEMKKLQCHCHFHFRFQSLFHCLYFHLN